MDTISGLLKEGADPNARFSDQRTPLFWAVRKDDFNAVNLLLSYKADVNAADLLGWTPLLAYLDWCNTECKPSMIRLLVDRGAKVSEKTLRFSYALPASEPVLHPEGVTNGLRLCRIISVAPSSNEEMKRFRRIAQALLHAKDALDDLDMCARIAVEADDLEMLRKAFILGADISSLLPDAVFYQNFESARFLMDNHANPDARNELGTTALLYAAMNNLHFMRKLLEYGANPNVIVNGETALDFAIRNDLHASAKALTQFGAEASRPAGNPDWQIPD